MAWQGCAHLRRLVAALATLLTLAILVPSTATSAYPITPLVYDSDDDVSDDGGHAESAWVPAGGDFRLHLPVTRLTRCDELPVETPAPQCRQTTPRAPPA